MLALTGLGLRIISVIWEQDHCASGWSWDQLGEDIESLNTNLSLVRKGESQWGEVLVFCVILGVCLSVWYICRYFYGESQGILLFFLTSPRSHASGRPISNNSKTFPESDQFLPWPLLTLIPATVVSHLNHEDRLFDTPFSPGSQSTLLKQYIKYPPHLEQNPVLMEVYRTLCEMDHFSFYFSHHGLLLVPIDFHLWTFARAIPFVSWVLPPGS